MKPYHIILTALIICLAGCQNKKNEIIISGRIEGPIPDKIEYTNPINGICNWWFTESVEPDSLGNFRIRFESEKPLFFKLGPSYKKQRTIIAEPGHRYDLILDLTEAYTLSFTDESSTLQEAYNKLPNPMHIQEGAREFLRDSMASKIKETIEQRRIDEIAEFEKLYSEKVISEELLNLVKTDRACYYNAVLATTMWIKKMLSMREQKIAFTAEFDQLWKEAFQPTLFSNPEIINSQWFNSYAESYLYFKDYLNGAFTKEKRDALSHADTVKTYRVSQAKEYLPAELCENYLAHFLFEESFQKKYERELIDLYDDFKTNYPTSQYHPYLSPLIDEIVEFHKIAGSPLNEKIHFVDDYQNRNTLTDLAGTFANGLIYVDVWATWCGPCKAEFEHREELKALLQENDIPVLYISIDREQDSDRWKNMVKFYNLEGYHVRANEPLSLELREIFGQNGRMSIPWYLLIKADGTILKKHASRPSKLMDLKREINQKQHES